MATIKLNAENKILTKNGKVSCGCCRGGGECCMYPAQALADGLYRWEDLPDELEYYFSTGALRFTLQKVAPRPIGANPEILYYEDIGGNDEAFIGLTEFGDQTPNQWEWAGGPATTNVDPSCLLADGTQAEPMDFKNYLLRDKFADTYTILDVESGQTIIVNRKSLCLWEEDNGGTRLFYNFGGPPPYNQYGAEIPRLIAWYIKDTPNLGDEGVSLPFSQQAGYGLGRLNTPVGNYGNSADDNPNSQIVFTVS